MGWRPPRTMTTSSAHQSRRKACLPLSSEGLLFKSKEYPLALPKKDSRGDFVFPPGTPLKRPKERPAGLSFGILSGGGREDGFTGDVGTGDEGMGAGCLRAFRGPCFLGDEVEESLVVLALGLGGYCPAGGRGSGTPGRRALRKTRDGGRAAGGVGPYGWLRMVSSTTLGRGSPPEPLGGQADSRGHR